MRMTLRKAGRRKSGKEKRDMFRTKRIPMSPARLIHLERLADDAHIRALDRKAEKQAEKKETRHKVWAVMYHPPALASSSNEQLYVYGHLRSAERACRSMKGSRVVPCEIVIGRRK